MVSLSLLDSVVDFFSLSPTLKQHLESTISKEIGRIAALK